MALLAGNGVQDNAGLIRRAGGTLRVGALAASALLLGVAAPACGGDDTDEAEAPLVAPDVDDVAIPEESSLVGLEVTAGGNVTEVIAPLAFRIDKDGLGGVTAGRFDDEDFGDAILSDVGVLVLDVAETGVKLGAAVRITGTVREFDMPEAERVFDVDFDDRVFGRFHDELVIVADKVTTAAARSGGSTATAPTTDPAHTDPPPAIPIVGLEVTATGNVTELIDPMAFRIDKDGVGDQPGPVIDDEAFDEVELAQRHVLVIDATKTGLSLAQPVRVTGTVRQLDLVEAERLFDVDLDDRLYAPFEQELVIFADEVTKLSGSTTTTR